jgi:hypothetical protein
MKPFLLLVLSLLLVTACVAQRAPLPDVFIFGFHYGICPTEECGFPGLYQATRNDVLVTQQAKMRLKKFK